MKVKVWKGSPGKLVKNFISSALLPISNLLSSPKTALNGILNWIFLIFCEYIAVRNKHYLENN